MNKKGFTLIELLVVISIIAIASGGAVVAFERSNADTNENDRLNKYLQIQRAGRLFIDTNDSWRRQLNQKSYIKIKLSELQSENYLEEDLYDSVAFEEFNKNDVILIYMYKMTKNGYNIEVLDSCFVTPKDNTGKKYKCIANSEGYSNDCCPKISSDLDVKDL